MEGILEETFDMCIGFGLARDCDSLIITTLLSVETMFDNGNVNGFNIWNIRHSFRSGLSSIGTICLEPKVDTTFTYNSNRRFKEYLQRLHRAQLGRF